MARSRYESQSAKEKSHRSTTVGGTADGSRRSTEDTLNMSASAGTGEVFRPRIASVMALLHPP